MDNATSEKLAKALGMMGSAHDGEVLNAARMAEKIRKSLNVSWTQMLNGKGNGNGSGNGSTSEMQAILLRAENAMLKAEVVSLRLKLARYGEKSEAKDEPKAKAEPKDPKAKAKATRRAAGGKTEQVAKLLWRASGASYEELVAVTEWSFGESYILRVARSYGAKVQKMKGTRHWRFVRA